MTTNIIQTLRPGLLVSVSVRSRGGRHYDKIELEATTTETGEERSRWETTRMIADPAEYARATKARSKAGNLIRRVCVPSAFGLLCLEDNEPKLLAAISEARTVIDEFNAGAQLTNIDLYVITGRIAQDDVEAARAIRAELNGMLDSMERGLAKLEVEQVRKTASQVAKIGQMLSVDAQRQVDDVVEAVRASCTKIVKAGETAAAELDAEVLAAMDKARTSFLDLDNAAEVAQPAQEGLALDLDVAAASDAYVAQAQATEPAGGYPMPGIEFDNWSQDDAAEQLLDAPSAPEIEFDNNNEGEQ